MIVILFKMKVMPAKRQELLMTLHSIVDQVQNENGYLEAGIYQGAEDENELLLIEEWSTQKDADAHLDSDIFTVLWGAGSLMLWPPEIVIHAVDQSTIYKPKTHEQSNITITEGAEK